MNDIPECLANISPKWYKILKQHGFEEIYGVGFLQDDINKQVDPDNYTYEEMLDINNTRCCIVGEAWGFKRYHENEQGDNCYFCNELSMQFFYIVSDDMQKAYTMEQAVKSFCEHVKKEHPQLIKEDCEE